MSENINEIMTALSKAQGKIQYASRDKSNPYFKSKYADLASIWEACRSSLSDHGLAVVQTIDHKECGMVLITMLGHSSGQWIRSEMPIIVAKNDPQTLGSAITYYRRYSLAAIVGVAPDDDDDGEKAQTSYRNSNKDEHKQKRAVSTIEVEGLKNILNECDPSYQEYVNEYLNKTFNISDVNQITYDLYEKMKTSATKKRNEYQLKKQEKFEKVT